MGGAFPPAQWRREGNVVGAKCVLWCIRCRNGVALLKVQTGDGSGISRVACVVSRIARRCVLPARVTGSRSALVARGVA